MYYDTIILRFFDDEYLKKENSYFLKEEGSYKSHYQKYLFSYWRVRISTKKTHETRATYISVGELKKYFNKIFPIATPHIKFDNPIINDNSIVYVKMSGRGKNLNYNLTELGHFIDSSVCTGFDIKYGIILNEIEAYKRKLHKFSLKNDIACHNEYNYAMYKYIKNETWMCCKKATSVLKFRNIILKNSIKTLKEVPEIVTAFYFEYTNNSLTEEFIEPEFIPLIRKLKLAQLFSD